ncbi:uncharacterized protein Ecym_1282 [Eremothecium cymbalariae DBVPG|uniref:JmjC domain-containing protein n=1 Tax=Eremothecium cymbalariae (strain CBS 270.75 / DBVPG 7215 / KCTC 17166 / NRRL Y-17582) TaxID=931890 RepID=G8JN57_ERECY|nr:hypothetical protein Ecym_1282 [Eremothecium cymbalariae DBVPG\
MNQDIKRTRKIPNYRVNTFMSAPAHPLGIKPSGNALLQGLDTKKDKELRKKYLGKLAEFPEELLVELLSYVSEPKDMQNLGCASRMLYAYTYEEEIWRKFYTREFSRLEREQGISNKDSQIYPYNCKKWRGSWRRTVLKLEEEQEVCLQCNDILFSDILYRPYQCSHIDYQNLFRKIIDFEKGSFDLGYNMNQEFGIDRFENSDFAWDKFKNEYINKPFILQSKKEPNRWPSWDLEYLVSKYPQVSFRQEAVKWELSLYADYCHKNNDESPLYLFDCNSEAMSQIKDKYQPPEIFCNDYFTLFQQDGINCRPDHRWLIVGPTRSGSTFHKDPNHTSAWNTTLSGMKLWVMLPPDVKPPGVSTDEAEEEVTCPVGIAEWILSGYYNDSVKLAQQGQCKIAVTFPGECLYVPAGWWHTVINLTDSVALTENFVPEPILPKVLNFFKNKKNQISGFHLKDLATSIEMFLRNNNECNNECNRLELFVKFLNTREQSNLDNEDCGVLNTLQFDPPIYEFFLELISKSEYRDKLPEAIEKLVIMEDEEARKKELSLAREHVRRSATWNKLTEQSNELFSFGFGDSN